MNVEIDIRNFSLKANLATRVMDIAALQRGKLLIIEDPSLMFSIGHVRYINILTWLRGHEFMTLLLGSAVKFSFMTFFAAHPMAAARPVRVAASMIVFTSLLSDMVYK